MARVRFDTVLVGVLFCVVGLFGFFAIRDGLRARKASATAKPPAVLSTDPMRGNKKAKVTIIEYGDFECSFCNSAQPMLTRLMAKYGDRVRLVWKDFPLPEHTHALAAATVAQCAAEQGKFWEASDALFAEQQLTDASYNRVASKLGLDGAALAACRQSDMIQARIDRSVSDGLRAAVDGTPYFFVNTTRVPELVSESAFEQVVVQQLSSS